MTTLFPKIDRPLRVLPPTAATATTVCGFCSTGCALDVQLREGWATGLTPSEPYPVNLGMACPKGWEALSVLDAPDRATIPLLRDGRGLRQPVSWDAALRTFTERLKKIQARHGPDSVAFLSTGQIVTEEMALLGALAKFGMGIVHGDGNTRQCMATAVVAYKQAFGFDAPPYTYADLEHSDVVVLVGSNLCIAHPILWERLRRNPHNPRIIALDPRRTETAMAATDHLPLRPKSDLTLLYGLANLLIERGWVDRSFIERHTQGFEAFAEHARGFTVEVVARETGLSPELIMRTAETIHTGRRVSFWWTMGVNQSHQGVRTAQAIINLALMTGNIGRPGTGANSITGQCNAMGSRLFSNTTNLLGGREFNNPDHRREVASALNLDERLIPSRDSLPYHRIIDGIADGKIKGLWVIGTNPAHSWVDQDRLRDLFGRLDFLVVQDMYHSTETARLADLLLPAAAWGEKEGTFINSERRIGRVRRVAKAPGEAMADFSIFKLVAHYWGCGGLFEAWESPAAVFQVLKKLSKGRPCDFSGISGYDTLDTCGGVQWPCPEEATRSGPPAQERRLFGDGRFFHADKRARFFHDTPQPAPARADDAYPLVLLTGRGSASQWHTQTRTDKSAVLRKLHPRRVYVEINPDDARSLGVAPNEIVAIESRHGAIRAQAHVAPTVRPGHVFIPMHYEATNRLTAGVFDPHSHQPAYKSCGVRVRRLVHHESKERP